AQMDRFIKKITDTLWVLKDKKIGVLGLAFKQNTDDVRMSPAIELCQRLQKEGASLRVHDPKAMEKARAVLKDATFVEDMNEVATGIIFRQGQLLITQRDADAHLGGLWEFPGGKREPNESFQECLARELREELGIEVSVGPLIETVTQPCPEKTVHLQFYHCW